MESASAFQYGEIIFESSDEYKWKQPLVDKRRGDRTSRFLVLRVYVKKSAGEQHRRKFNLTSSTGTRGFERCVEY